jgi:hypothetical protein
LIIVFVSVVLPASLENRVVGMRRVISVFGAPTPACAEVTYFVKNACQDGSSSMTTVPFCALT